MTSCAPPSWHRDYVNPLAVGSNGIVDALRIIIAHGPHRRHARLIGKVDEPEGVAEPSKVYELSETNLVRKAIGVASGATIEDCIERVAPRVADRNIDALIAMSALFVPATLECCVGTHRAGHLKSQLAAG